MVGTHTCAALLHPTFLIWSNKVACVCVCVCVSCTVEWRNRGGRVRGERDGGSVMIMKSYSEQSVCKGHCVSVWNHSFPSLSPISP